ncbi:MAG: hypothetical protein AAFZ11_12495 [Pseudomonadota bacterium]
MFYFRAYGQIVESELALPEFEPLDPQECAPPIEPGLRIKLCALPHVPVEERNAEGFRVRDGVIDFEVRGLVRIRVASQDCIEVDLLDAERQREARLYVTGSGFGIWVFATGRIPFHCGLVTRDGLGFAITGPSGVGKSTLTTALVERGFGFMSDDVVVLDPVDSAEDAGSVAITPSFPRIKLWQDAADHFAIETGALDRLHTEMDKFHVPFQQDKVVDRATLAAVIRLQFDDTVKTPSCRAMPLPEALRELRSNIYRPSLVTDLGLEETAFSLISTILQTVPVLDLARPRDLDRFEDTVEAFVSAVEGLDEPESSDLNA